MGALNGQYPQELGKVVAHAKRLVKVLTKLERIRADAWFRSRSGEVRGIVSLALADWRSGVSDTEKTCQTITTYVDTLHRGASKKLRCGLALECCEADDVITAVGGEEARPAIGLEAASGVGTPATTAPTVRSGWVDSPEMLARVRNGLGLVEASARAVMRRVGDGGATMDDLRAFGREGLLDAARAFDERRGIPFEPWAAQRIRHAMIDGVRRWGAVPARARRGLRALEAADAALHANDRGHAKEQSSRRSTEVFGGASLRASLTAMPVGAFDMDGELLEEVGLTPEEALAKAELASLVREIVGKLPKRERELVERSYFNGETPEEAAVSMGVSRSWAHRVHAHAIEILQRALRKRDCDPVDVGGRGCAPRRS